MARGSTSDDARLTPRRRGTGGPLLLSLLALAGCGSASVAELPPAVGPDRAPAERRTPTGTVIQARTPATPLAAITKATLRDGSLRAVLDPKARVLTIQDAATGASRSHATVGVGPTNVACAPQGPCFVTDTQGDALLVLRVGDGGRSLRLTRRVFLAGAPYAITVDPERRRLWVTLTARNELVELGAHGRPHVLGRLPTLRQPDAVQVDIASGDVTVRSPDGRSQRLPDPATPDR